MNPRRPLHHKTTNGTKTWQSKWTKVIYSRGRRIHDGPYITYMFDDINTMKVVYTSYKNMYSWEISSEHNFIYLNIFRFFLTWDWLQIFVMN